MADYWKKFFEGTDRKMPTKESLSPSVDAYTQRFKPQELYSILDQPSAGPYQKAAAYLALDRMNATGPYHAFLESLNKENSVRDRVIDTQMPFNIDMAEQYAPQPQPVAAPVSDRPPVNITGYSPQQDYSRNAPMIPPRQGGFNIPAPYAAPNTPQMPRIEADRNARMQQIMDTQWPDGMPNIPPHGAAPAPGGIPDPFVGDEYMAGPRRNPYMPDYNDETGIVDPIRAAEIDLQRRMAAGGLGLDRPGPGGRTPIRPSPMPSTGSTPAALPPAGRDPRVPNMLPTPGAPSPDVPSPSFTPGGMPEMPAVSGGGGAGGVGYSADSMRMMLANLEESLPAKPDRPDMENVGDDYAQDNWGRMLISAGLAIAKSDQGLATDLAEGINAGMNKYEGMRETGRREAREDYAMALQDYNTDLARHGVKMDIGRMGMEIEKMDMDRDYMNAQLGLSAERNSIAAWQAQMAAYQNDPQTRAYWNAKAKEYETLTMVSLMSKTMGISPKDAMRQLVGGDNKTAIALLNNMPQPGDDKYATMMEFQGDQGKALEAYQQDYMMWLQNAMTVLGGNVPADPRKAYGESLLK